jgi:hypothetical protein
VGSTVTPLYDIIIINHLRCLSVTTLNQYILLEDSVATSKAETSFKEYLQITGKLGTPDNSDSSENPIANRLALRAHNTTSNRKTSEIVCVELEVTALTALTLDPNQTSMGSLLLRRSVMNNERSTAAIW